MEVSSGQALAWRLTRHHLLDGAGSVTDVVRRLGAVPAWSGDADLALRRRVSRPSPDAVSGALAAGELIVSYAFRGATHLLAADEAGSYLALRCAGRQWLLKSWQDHYDLSPDDWPRLRELVREAVAGEPISQQQLAGAVAADARFRHLEAAFVDRNHTLIKPFAWQGDLCFGPVRDGRATFSSPRHSPHWTGLPDLDDAGRRAVLNYLGGYGPATRDNLHYWLVNGLSAGRRRVDGWITELAEDQIVDVEVDGVAALHLRTELDSLSRTEPIDQVILLPGHDQWVLGPGTSDERIVPGAHRAEVTRGAHLVLHAGVVSGTWRVEGEAVDVTWFDAGPAPKRQLRTEVERLAGLLGRDLVVRSA